MAEHDTEAFECLRIVSIDPGTNALGVAVLDIDIETKQITVQHVFTLNVDKYSQRYPHIQEKHGDRIAKLHSVHVALYRFFMGWKPTYIVSEAPYMGRFPQAYAALVECISAIRRAVSDYNPGLTLPSIDPASVKKSVGVSGKSGDKDAMKEAIRQLKDLILLENIDSLDEHAIDAIAVGYAYYKAHG